MTKLHLEGDAPVHGLWRRQSTSLLPLLPGPPINIINIKSDYLKQMIIIKQELIIEPIQLFEK